MLPGPPAQARVSLLEPFLHRLRIAFIGPVQRLLRGDVQAGQPLGPELVAEGQPAHRRELQADSKLLLNEPGHDLRRFIAFAVIPGGV